MAVIDGKFCLKTSA